MHTTVSASYQICVIQPLTLNHSLQTDPARKKETKRSRVGHGHGLIDSSRVRGGYGGRLPSVLIIVNFN